MSHCWKYSTFFCTNFSISPGWVSFSDVFELRDGDFLSALKLPTVWGSSPIDAPRVPLNVEELDEESVVMGEGMSLPVILDRLGAFGLP